MAEVTSIGALAVSLASLGLSLASYRRGAPRPKIKHQIPVKFHRSWTDAIDTELTVVNNGSADLRVTDIRCLLIAHFGDECVERFWACPPVDDVTPIVVPKFEGVATRVAIPLTQSRWPNIGEQDGTKIALRVELSNGTVLTTKYQRVDESWLDRIRQQYRRDRDGL